MPMVFREPLTPMKMTLRSFFAALLLALPHAAGATDLSDADKTFLAGYEKVRAALAANQFDAAKSAASELGEEGATLAKSDKLEAARAEFTKLSERAVQLGSGKEGFYVVRCPMLRKEWLQPQGKISNPYDAAMPECGVIKK